MRELEDKDYKRLYRLYLAALKALSFLETERYLKKIYSNIPIIVLFESLILSFSGDLERGLKPLPAYVERVLQSTNDNVMVWSQYFYKNPSPTKIKYVKILPSPATRRIGGLLHSVGSYAGLTAEAVWYFNIYFINAENELISNEL